MLFEKFRKWIKKDLLQPQVSVKSGSTPEGNGVFAKKDICEGSDIGFFDGSEQTTATKMSVQFGENLHIEPSADTPFRYLNHSCNANAYFRRRNLYAWRKIIKGEEITIDYNCSEKKLSSPFKCNCRNAGCVGQVKGFNFLDAPQRIARQRKILRWLIPS